MRERLTIGQLAKAADVPISTVRYYERTGLIRPAGRTAHNYRYYGPDAVERLRFVKAAQASGFSLGDISSLLDLRDRDAAPCESVRDVLDHRLADVRQRIDDLSHVRQVLETARRKCEADEPSGRCSVINDLHHAASTRESAS